MYAPVTAALGQLVNQDQAPPLSSSVPLNAGPPAERTEQEQPDPRRDVRDSRHHVPLVNEHTAIPAPDA